MLTQQPIVTREVEDNELRRMLDIAWESKDTDDFFGRFQYYIPGQPFLTLLCGEALLSKCKKLAPVAYAKLWPDLIE
jgi:hypothetical protein